MLANPYSGLSLSLFNQLESPQWEVGKCRTERWSTPGRKVQGEMKNPHFGGFVDFGFLNCYPGYRAEARPHPTPTSAPGVRRKVGDNS